MSGVIRVLVVDDSAYVRKVVKQMLSRSPFIEVVGTARDGMDALEQVELLKPDVVTLDLIMPVMDGVEFLRKQMALRPLPVVVVSIASESGEKAIAALDAGAVDFVQKPTALATDKVLEISDELIEKVKAAAQVPLARLRPQKPVEASAVVAPSVTGRGEVDVVVIGISTGGPQALKHMIPQLPSEFPVPVVVVLHMPVGYTEMYAKSLGAMSRLKVIEASEGDPLRPGVVMIAPAGRHLTFLRGGNGEAYVHLDAKPFDTAHRPSVDVMFESAAKTFGSRVLGVVMTGMGADGKEGAAWIKAQGGVIFTEAEETCIVYGMPRSVDEAGLSDRRVPLQQMAGAIVALV